MLWTDKYRPRSFDRFIGNADAVAAVQKWAQGWQHGRRQKPLLFYGPAGCGKTALAHLTAEEMGWEAIETNASDVRTKNELLELLGPSSQNTTLTGGTRLIIIDEIDGVSDRGTIPAVAEILEQTAQPVILIANDPYAKTSLKPLRRATEFIKFSPVHEHSILSLLKYIATKENLEISDVLMSEIAASSHGDVRAAILDLQSLGVSWRDRALDVYKGLGAMFKGDFDNGRKAVRDIDLDPEMLMAWIEENIPREYQDPEDRYSALETLSRASVFEGRIKRRQNWSLRRYSMDLATGGVAAAKKRNYKQFTRYYFPKFISELSASQRKRALLKGIAEKIGPSLHLSRREVVQFLPIMAKFISPERYNLSEEETELLERYKG